MWRVGDRVSHRFNTVLGPGLVAGADGRRVLVDFPDAEERLIFAATTDALVQLTIEPGIRVRFETTGEEATVAESLEGDRYRLRDGREVAGHELWPLPLEESPVERLARGAVDRLADFTNRLAALRLERVREAHGLGSFLGGRIRLYAHQLYAAESACASEPARWLLADGVGLGKTVEACLIMNRLIHTGRAERTLVVAPESLTVQWLGELWRKHHQIFVLLDEPRIAEVALDQGIDFNPFEVHRRAIIALETLCDDPRLTEMAVAAGIDLLVVDEAHHLQRPQGHPGNLAYRAIAPIAALDRNLLLLTATPLEDDATGFMRLVQLLRPEHFPEDQPLLERLARRRSLPPCTTATRAADIGGWPPRTPSPVDLDEKDWLPIQRLEDHMRSRDASNEVARANKARFVSRALASPAALRAVLTRRSKALSKALAEAELADPRLRWLVETAPRWRERGEKTLVFVAHRETLETIKSALERQAHLRVGLFHEELSIKRRDIEVAQLTLPEGPSLLVSTECGGEGRNFEMCHRLVLYDMPWHPGVVEQRIGRLDRIGRTRATEIVYFRPATGLGAAVVRLFEEMGLFRESLGGIDRELRHVAREIARVAAGPPEESAQDLFADLLDRALQARTRVQEAAYHELHRSPYKQPMAEEILARVPADLETLTSELVLDAAATFGFDMEEEGGASTWLIGLGVEALVDRLPGVAPGTRFLGTFNRDEAVARETIDFFSSGHPLVEGILSELHEGSRGRTACLEVAGEEEGFGLLAIFKRGAAVEAVAVDAAGRSRPDLAERLLAPDCRLEAADHRVWTAMPRWREAIEGMANALPDGENPQAVAAFRVRSG